MPEVKFETSSRGWSPSIDPASGRRQGGTGDGSRPPHVRVVPNPRVGICPRESIGWTLPIDDTSFTQYTSTAGQTRQATFGRMRLEFTASSEWDMIRKQEHKQFPRIRGRQARGR